MHSHDDPPSLHLDRSHLADEESLLTEFEDAWQSGQSPAIDSFLARAAAQSRSRLLLEMILTELELRIKPATQPLAAHYLGRFPDLLQDSATAQRIIAAEFTLRRRFVEPTLTADLYLSRLPAALGQQLQSVRDSLRALEQEPAATPQPASPFDSTQVASHPNAGKPGVPARFGEYEILEVIGQGGMGIVYRARQLGLNRTVALKRIREAEFASAEEIGRFYAEAQAAAALDHPGIVPIFEVGQLSGHPFFAMGFVEGHDLGKRLTLSPLEPPEAAQLLKQVAEAVEYAHRQGIIHRDLKPANILLDSTGQPRVTDFGLAKRLNSDRGQSQTGVLIGTACFAPPEQARYKPELVGPRSDVYSLGAVLYALLTGRPPFQAASFDETIRQVIEQEPVPPRRLNPSVPLDLETIALKCLEKHPDQRYASAQAVADELSRFINGEPILARPISRVSRAARWCQRKPVAAGLIAVATVLVLVLSIGGPVVAVIIADREIRARNAAATSTAINAFLQDDLLSLAGAGEQADAGIKADSNLKVRDLVIRAATKIEGKFKDQPLVEIRVRDTLGNALRNIAEYPLAIDNLQKSLTLAIQELGANHSQTLATKNALALTYLDAGDVKRAFPLCEELLRWHRAQNDPEQLDVSLNNMGLAYQRANRLDLAQPLWEEVLKIRQRHSGPKHPLTLMAMHNLGSLYADTAQSERALAMLQETLRLRQETIGADHPYTLFTMHSLALVHADLGDSERALSLLEQVVDLKKGSFGPEHPSTLRSMNALALRYTSLGEMAKAIEMYEETLKLRKNCLGPAHQETLETMASLGGALVNNRQYEAALSLLEETLTLQRTHLGASHSNTFVTLVNLGATFQETGKHDQAIATFEEALKLSESLPDPRPPAHLLALKYNLATAYRDADQPAKAIDFLTAELQRRQEKLGAAHPDTIQVLADLAATEVKLKQFDKAEARLQDAFASAQKFQFPQKEASSVQIGIVLLKVFEATARPEEAAKWRSQIEQWLDVLESPVPK